MRKALSAMALFATCAVQAQVLYVNNNDNTYQAIDTKETREITFDESAQTIRIMQNNGVASMFSTNGIESIALATTKQTGLTYTLTPTVAFDANDSNSYNEVIETIVTDELDEEYDDFVENYSVNRVFTINFGETGVKISPTLPTDITATINGSHITIKSQRSKVAYKVTGTCSNGSLKIYSEKKFQIMAQNINLTNPTGPAINIQSGKTVYFTIMDGTNNTLCDGTTYNAPTVGSDGTEEDQKGTLFSEGQVIFNGKGTLNVTSHSGHAICSDDYIRVRSGNINIAAAAKDGFRAKDKFIMGRTTDSAPVITVNATSNGIECTEGSLTIEAGKLDITSGGEAIKVVYDEPEADPTIISDAYIKGGYIKIVTTGEKSSALQTTGNYTQSGGIIQAEVKGDGSKIINCDGAVSFVNGKITGFVNGSVSSDETSAGGIKSAGNVNITNGKIAIECKGRGAKGINCDSNVHVDGGDITLLVTAENYTDIADDKKTRAITAINMTVNGGKVVTSAYDHAIYVDGTFTINSGTVNAFSSSSYATSVEAVQTGGWLLYKDYE